ncbi:PQQ-binding-like beta-propeller repeat protein [Streptomyces sp. A 4/2]|uniref:outer membrane protein assembly factor BamB family protein n=1 Tax=Streptomyces sp. A 4/2 TaxID=2934314 RepID=UPI0020254709|nr:PQQ-binding-like beta-propeller repeat protein [Streptomyces sp. A 4/2]
MTQPPQPPDGPPQGGFGKQPPAQPPAGGYGAPTPPLNPPPAPPQMPPQAPPPQAPPVQAPPPQMPPQGGPPQFGHPQHQQPQPGQHQQPGQPQDPAYGYPQTPPGQPGYGYPQHQQPTPPYGHPPQHQQGQPPAYGFPTQPTPQYGGPGAGPGGSGSGGGGKFGVQAKIITAAAVAIVLIVGAGFVYSSSKDDNKNQVSTAGPTGGGKDGKGDGGDSGTAGGKEKVPANTDSKVLFQIPAPKVADVTGVNGSWMTDKLYVKSGVNEIIGYDAVKGSQVWKLPLPGPLCVASSEVSKDHRTAIGFQEKVPTKAKPYWGCTEISALDLDTGKLLWQKSYKDGDRKVDVSELTVGPGVVAAGSLSGGAAWDLESGALRWSPKPTTDRCEDAGYGGGNALVAVRRCGDYENPQLSIQTLDPKTGAPASTYRMPSGIQYGHIVSSDPLVVAADINDSAGDGSSISDYFSIDGKTGKLRARISADADQYGGDCDSTEVQPCTNLAVGNDRLYVPTEKHDGVGEGAGQTNEIVAFDLATGNLAPGKANAGPGYAAYPVRMDGSNLIAYKTGPYDKGGQVVSINGTTLKETVLMNNPADEAVRRAEQTFLPDHAEIRFANGRLYLADDTISDLTSESEKSYLAIGFGTG